MSSTDTPIELFGRYCPGTFVVGKMPQYIVLQYSAWSHKAPRPIGDGTTAQSWDSEGWILE